jgi:hypothetical protein
MVEATCTSLPVVANDQLVGIVARADILDALHRAAVDTGPPVVEAPSPPASVEPAPDDKDPDTWPAAALTAIQTVLDRSRAGAGRAVLETFDHPERRMDAREFVRFWNEVRLKAMATVGRPGAPHLAPVHAEFRAGRPRSTIYEDAQRRRDLRANPRVAFSTWGPHGAAAIVYGVAREVPDSLRESRPGASGSARRTVALDIEVTRIYAMKPRPVP